jgi:ribosomal protein S18 acetylase RimI-like enzyme
MKNMYSKIKHVYKKSGIKGLKKAVFSKFYGFLWKSNCSMWFERSLNQPFNNITPELPIYISFSGNNETIEWIQRNKDDWYFMRKEIDVAIRNGHFFPHVKTDDNKIIGYMKIGCNTVFVKDFDRNITFPRGTAFVYDTYVSEEYRKKRVAQVMITEVMKYLKQRGYDHLRCHIEMWNKPSLEAYKKIGFEELKKIRFLRILGLELLSGDPLKL